MKNPIIYSLAGLIALWMMLSAFKPLDSTKKSSQTSLGAYVLIDVYEVPDYSDKGVHVHYSKGHTKVYPFKDFVSENHDNNGELLVSVINELHTQGYEITSTSAGKAPNGVITKIFMKQIVEE